MNGVSSATNAAQLLQMLANARTNSTAATFSAESNAANSAASNAATPPSLPSGAQLSMQTLLALQSDEPTQTAASSSPSVEDRFLEEAHKSPIQRLREQILDSLGLTEDQLNALPADQRRAIEDKITKIIREKIREAAGADPNTQQSDGASEAVSALQDFA